ncbi:MAG TPA: choice-of-anchor D domain-containing protein [Longimicrobiales bacterium]|nr:choice-of-anchor D domain-containing protein [Longimicrobiales bacterium]
MGNPVASPLPSHARSAVRMPFSGGVSILLVGAALLLPGCDSPLTVPSEAAEESGTPGIGLPSFGLEPVAQTTAAASPTFLVTPIGFDFGEVQVGSTSPPTVTTVTNVSALPVVVSSAGGAPGAPFGASQSCQGVTLDPGDSCAFSYSFSPTAAGAATATSSFTLNGEPFSVDLAGVGVDPKFLVSPTAFDFGEVQVGTASGPMTTTVTNIGSAPVTVSGAGGAPGAPFGASQSCQGVTLNPGDSCAFLYTFDPTATGPFSASSNFSLNGVSFSVDLSGIGVPPSFRVTPAGHDFGEVQVGTSSGPAATTITNVGSAPVTVSGAGGAPGAPFGASQSCQGVTLNPGDSCAFFYTFDPTATGPFSASSNFSLNGVSFSVDLSGIGIPAGSSPTSQFQVTPTAHDFGSLQVGETSTQAATTVTNTGPSPVVVSGAGGAPGAPFGASQNCQGVTLNPGDSCSFFYTFTPSAAGPAAATSTFSLNGESFSVDLTGTGVDPKFLVTPTGLEFGDWQVGTTSAQMTATVTNVGLAAVTVSGAGGAPGAPFGASQSCQGVTLDPGDSCAFFYTFTPSAPGPVSASSTFSLNGSPFTVDLSGTGLDPKFLVTPTGHDFGGYAIGTTSAPVQTTVTNVGLAPTTVSGAGGATGPPFGASQSCQGVTLDPGDSCAFHYTFSPTGGGSFSATSSFALNGQPFEVDLLGFGLGDSEGPATDAVLATPNPVSVDGAFRVSATVTDAASTVRSAEYGIDGGPWSPMSASDGTFDQEAETVLADGTAPGDAGIYDLCVRGTDAAGNTGPPACTLLVAFDPDGGFVTGAGWFDSPTGAFVEDPGLVGRATFAFVSKYMRGRIAPEGSTSFRFQAAGLRFQSDRYDFLVVNQAGTNAQFKGEGLINGMTAPNGTLFKFIIWANTADPDTFRIRIWWEDGGTEHGVYDSGVEELGGGSITIHR